MGYYWCILRDYITNGEDNGRDNSREITPESIRELMDSAPYRTYFKMYDGDGELYYDGYIVGDFSGFEPLDEFGTPNAGCTEIKLKDNDGVYQTL